LDLGLISSTFSTFFYSFLGVSTFFYSFLGLSTFLVVLGDSIGLDSVFGGVTFCLVSAFGAYLVDFFTYLGTYFYLVCLTFTYFGY
jgi:hypothetical protein